MKEIIEQISRIDAVAFENEQKNRSVLSNERQRFDNEIKRYREQKLEIANNNAKIIYNQIINNANKEYRMQEEKMKQISGMTGEKYLKIEKDILNEVFDKLFYNYSKQ